VNAHAFEGNGPREGDLREWRQWLAHLQFGRHAAPHANPKT
jgi:hypothetical protein